VREADVILAIGPRLGEMTTSGYSLLASPVPAQRLIHVHADAEELGSVYQAELMINSGMPQVAAMLAAMPPVDASARGRPAWPRRKADYAHGSSSRPSSRTARRRSTCGKWCSRSTS
jgi:acetolactate synthase-1/2/3 large subunit